MTAPLRTLTAAAAGPIAIQCSLLSRRGGGLPAAILPVAQRLGRERLIVTPDAPEEPGGLTVLPPGRGRLEQWRGRALQGRGVRLVHTHGLWSGLSLAAMAWRQRTGRPTIVSPHGMLDPWALSQRRTKKQLALAMVERRHMSGARVVHALCTAEAEAIRAAGVTAPIAVIPNGVGPAPAHPPPPPAWMDRPTLLFLGRLHPKKGLAPLIDAWALAVPSLPGWQLAIAGWDDGPNDYRERAARTGAKILFPGGIFGAEKAAALANARALVLPSLSEGLPMTVLEAWAHGTPVLMTEACNLPDGFQAGAALRVQANPRCLAEALVCYLGTPGRLSGLGPAGRALVARRYGWQAIARRMDALYAYALGETDKNADIVAI